MKRRQTDVRTVRAALNDHVNGTDDTAADIAREAGISKAAVSMFKTGKYHGDNSGIAGKLAPILEYRQAQTEIMSGEREMVYWVQYLTDKGKLRWTITKNQRLAQERLDTKQTVTGFTCWQDKKAEKPPYFQPWAGKRDETVGD